jgi:hypothetical protein
MFSNFVRVNPYKLKYGKKHIKWSIEQLITKRNILKNGYNPRLSCIVISNDNFIVDGHHRVESIKLIDCDKIIVKKIILNYKLYLSLFIILIILLLPVLTPIVTYKILKNEFKRNLKRHKANIRRKKKRL